MGEPIKIKISPNMTLYKQKGFMLYNVIKVNSTKGIVEIQKMFSDVAEPPMTMEQLLLDIEKKRIKLLNPAETKEYVKEAAKKIKNTKARLNLALKLVEKKEEQYSQFKRRTDEYERTILRS